MKKFLKSIFTTKPNPALIIHFDYHKCMTFFFEQLFRCYTIENDWYYELFQATEGDKLIEQANNKSKNQILQINTVLNDISALPGYYTGSHIIRDPRDLLVSGYNYHIWSPDSWSREPMTDIMRKDLKIDSFKIEKDTSGYTYHDLINEVDKETGLMIELNWRHFCFSHMFK